MSLTGFEDQARHQPRKRSRFPLNWKRMMTDAGWPMTEKIKGAGASPGCVSSVIGHRSSVIAPSAYEGAKNARIVAPPCSTIPRITK